MDIEKFVQNLKSRLDAAGISYARAGRESGAGEEFIRNMERKKSSPSIDKVQMMADYLGVTTSELLGENEKPATVTGDGQVAKLAAALISQGVDIDALPVSRLDQIARLIKVHLDE